MSESSFQLPVAALVSLDKRDTYEVRLPGLLAEDFRGPSVSELLDDAALALMEVVPKWPMARLQRLLLSPDVTIRRVGVDTRVAFGKVRKKTEVKLRLTCFCTRWSTENFWRVCVPRLGSETFAVPSLSGLDDRLAHYLQEWGKTNTRQRLFAAASLQEAHLELMDVELELPSVLPSRIPKKKKRRPTNAGAPKKPEERKWIPAYELRGVGVNLVQRANDGRLQPALGRDAHVADLVEQLDKPGSAILLVGASGVGKTAIIEAVAQVFAARKGTLQERTDVWRVDGARLIAGMSVVGAWESRMANIVSELFHREDVLVVDDLPSLAWTGRSAQSETTMAGFLMPHLRLGEIKVLAECTPERLEAGRLKNPGFFANFRVIHVDPLDEDATYRVMLQQLRVVEQRRTLASEPDLLRAVTSLANRFGARIEEPGRSVRMLQEFLGDVVPPQKDRFGRGVVRVRDLHGHFSLTTGLPSFILEPHTGDSPSAIRSWFTRHIVGQPRAVEAAMDTVLTLQQGLDDPDRPVATLLFVGPTGVGKTETAKALARYLFGDVTRLLRFDMSEVSGPGGVARLVGGLGRLDGDLTRAVANQPFSVLLLDEIEKAGPEVFDLLLQVLGEGRLTNAVGRTTDFRNCVVVMTSNLGVAAARRRTGFDRGGTEDDAAHFRAAAQGFFRPEFFNRIDRVVPFRALGKDDVEPLVQRIVGRVLSRRGLRRAGVVVQLEDGVRDWIAEIGFDPAYGARSLQRVVEREITVPLARRLVDEPPGTRGAYIEVWRDPTGLRLALDPLADAPRDPIPLHIVADWAAMAELHARLLALHQEVVETSNWEAIRQARTALLDELNHHELDVDGWDRLHGTSAVVEEHAALASELEDFESDWLATYRYSDGWQKIGGELGGRGQWYYSRERLVPKQEPIPIDKKRGLKKASLTLSKLEERVGAMRFRVENWGAFEPLFLRFDALHGEGQSFALELARAFQEAWTGWGQLHCWSKTDTWTEDWTEGGTYALSLRAPGLRHMVLPETGYYLDGSDLGPDRLLRLVEVSLVEGGGVAALQADDLQRERARDHRREGESGAIGVTHRFGVLRPDDEGAPVLESLGAQLRSRAFRRVVR